MRTRVLYVCCCCLIIFTMPLLALSLPCRKINYRFEDNNLVLNSNRVTKQPLFLLNNIMNADVIINHVKHTSLQAGWSSKISSHYFSVIAVTTRNFVINCSWITGNQFHPLDCQKVIKVCLINHAKLPHNLYQSNFWLVEDKTIEQIEPAMLARKVKIIKR